MKLSNITQTVLIVLILFQTACEKSPVVTPLPPPEIQPQEPPQPAVEDAIFVSAEYGEYNLSSYSYPDASSRSRESYFKTNGSIRWTCMVRPDQSPIPLLLTPDSISTVVKNLAKGVYFFEVTYRTDLGAKSTNTKVTVVEDGLANSQKVFQQLTWSESKGEGGFFGEPFWLFGLEIKNRPDLFCYRGSKTPKVEIQDALNNEWRTVPAFHTDASGGILTNPYFHIDAHENLRIVYDAFISADTVFNRLVKQKTAIRLSL